MKSVALLPIALLLASCVTGRPVQVPEESPLVSGLDEAANRALSPLRDIKASHEQAGALLRSPDGQYSYTAPVFQARDSFALRLHLSAGWKLVGIYHTHPGDDRLSQMFSADDLDTAKQLGVPSYVLFQGTGEIRKYIPGQTQTQLTPVRNGMSRTAEGDAISL